MNLEGITGITRDMSKFSLDAYLTRIGIPSEAAKHFRPDLETLRAIIKHHTQSIPFENLDILQGKRIGLETTSIVKKLLEDKRGGYCFEQNLLLSHALEALGFTFKLAGGRIRYYVDGRAAVPPRTHLFLIVNNVEKSGDAWIVDSGPVPTHSSILRFVLDEEQETSHDIRRVIRESHPVEGEKYYIQVQTPVVVDGKSKITWRDSVEFTLEAFHLIDIEVANWFTSTCPLSHFSYKLIVARAGSDKDLHGEGSRIYTNEEVFNVRARDGSIVENIPITNRSQLLSILSDRFGIRIASDVHLGPAGAPWATLIEH